jgi:GNAT superfamily N-acetyltransferase
MPTLELRTLRREESGVVRELILDILNIEYAMALSLAELPDLADAYDTYLASGDGHFWVAVLDGRIAGCNGVLRLSGNDFELRRMYVRPECRGLGIAQRLLDLLLEWCLARGVGCLYLETNGLWTAAHHLYEKNGFAPVDRDALPAGFPVVRVATGFYRRCLATAEA